MAVEIGSIRGLGWMVDGCVIACSMALACHLAESEPLSCSAASGAEEGMVERGRVWMEG